MKNGPACFGLPAIPVAVYHRHRLEALFWYGFSLPFPPPLALARVVLVAAA